VQRIAIDAKNGGGLQLIAAGPFEGELDKRPLDALDEGLQLVLGKAGGGFFFFCGGIWT
jgi:hypothetical protein